MQLRWQWSRVGPVTAVFGGAAVVLLALLIADGVALRTGLAFPSGLVPDPFRQIWWELSRTHVLVLGMSVVAAVATHVVLRPVPRAGHAHRLELVGAVIWAAGALVVAGLPGLPRSDDGWFNYAPNAGVVFSSGEGPNRELIGLVVAGIGLAITVGAIIWSFVRHRDDDDEG